MKVNRYNAVDLFCGCGGISFGLKKAGFNIIAGVDIEPKYMATFSYNFPESKSLKLDLSKISASDFLNIINIKPGELTLLAGGPPCQGFSKNVPKKYRYLDDPNNRLIRIFIDYAKIIKPHLILMENVAEMKNGFKQAYTDEIISNLEAEGYEVNYAVLNAADYGVPQRRRRAFFIANRYGKIITFPSPTHTQNEKQNEKQHMLFESEKHVTIWDAIGDLTSLKHGEGEEVSYYACEPFSIYQLTMRNGQKTVTNHIARKLQPKQYERISYLKPGEGHKDLPKHLQVKGGYSGAYGRLTKDMIAPTITRWVFHPGSGRWGHPVDLRTLTIREVARLQSFSDNFNFIGSYNQQCGQLGNAVPPILVQIIAKNMLVQSELSSRERRYRKSSKESFSFSEGNVKDVV